MLETIAVLRLKGVATISSRRGSANYFFYEVVVILSGIILDSHYL